MDKAFHWVSHIEIDPTSSRHMTFSPTDQRWLLSDTDLHSTMHKCILFLYDMKTGARIDLGSFHADPKLSQEIRCDLHPR